MVADFGTKLRPMVRFFKAAPRAAAFHLTQFLGKHGLNWRRSDLQKSVNEVCPISKSNQLKKKASFSRQSHIDSDHLQVRVVSTKQVVRWLERQFDCTFVNAKPPMEVIEPPPVKTIRQRLYESTPQPVLKAIFPTIRGEVTYAKLARKFGNVKKSGSG
jgi:hypothetical protein